MQKNEDNWAQLLTDLGLETPAKESDPETTDAKQKVDSETSKPVAEEFESIPGAQPDNLRGSSNQEVMKQTEEEPESSFGKGLLDDLSVESPPKKPRENKKTFFDRFPKINLFGTPAKESLDAVVEGVKTPSLSGKSFTSKKLEKAPERTARSETPTAPAIEKPVPNELPEERPVLADSPVLGEDDPWSKIATQVGTISSNKKTTNEKRSDSKSSKKESTYSGRRSGETTEASRSRRALPSLFDEGTPSESDEAAALKRLIDESDFDASREEAERLDSLFENGGDRPRARRDAVPASYRKETENEAEGDRSTGSEPHSKGRGRRRGTKQRNWETAEKENGLSFEESPEEPTKEKTRGRRGSRYVERAGEEQVVFARERSDETRFSEEEFDLDAEYAESTWDIEEESKPVERAPRSGHRRGRRSESRDRNSNRSDPAVPSTAEPAEDLSSASAGEPIHRNIPSWDDAISLIIQGNKERHAQKASESRRGRR